MAATAYLDNDTLRRLIRRHRRSGRVSEELTAALTKIAAGVFDRYAFISEKEDFVQECLLHFLSGPLARVDLDRHVFNYFTTCAIHLGYKLRDKVHSDARRLAGYRDRVLEDHRQRLDSLEDYPWDDT